MPFEDPLKQLRQSIESEAKRISEAYRPPVTLMPVMRTEERQLRQMRDLTDVLQSAPKSQATAINTAIRAHITGLQSKLKSDEQLLVYSMSGPTVIVVHNIAFPDGYTVILQGQDIDGNETSMIASIGMVQLTCKIVKTSEKPYKIGFVPPEPASAVDNSTPPHADKP